jgi:hypothetical protein
MRESRYLIIMQLLLHVSSLNALGCRRRRGASTGTADRLQSLQNGRSNCDSSENRTSRKGRTTMPEHHWTSLPCGVKRRPATERPGPPPAGPRRRRRPERRPPAPCALDPGCQAVRAGGRRHCERHCEPDAAGRRRPPAAGSLRSRAPGPARGRYPRPGRGAPWAAGRGADPDPRTGGRARTRAARASAPAAGCRARGAGVPAPTRKPP